MFSICSNCRIKLWKNYIKPFINKHNWKKINYPSKIDDWKKLEKNNPTIALNILYTIEKRNTSTLNFKSKPKQ